MASNFKEVSVSVVECPDLTLPTWNLAAPGKWIRTGVPLVYHFVNFAHVKYVRLNGRYFLVHHQSVRRLTISVTGQIRWLICRGMRFS